VAILGMVTLHGEEKVQKLASESMMIDYNNENDDDL
jgi:hypothetical protein